jgi:sterol 24-C-methyltransferase
MKVLDVGCGIGGPAREIATFSDCHVVGLNNNAYQIERAKKLSCLWDKVEFLEGDFMVPSFLFMLELGGF